MKERTKTFLITFTPEEYQQVKKDAEEKHMKIAVYIRFLLQCNQGKSIGEILKCSK